jgi:hypothetical protein
MAVRVSLAVLVSPSWFQIQGKPTTKQFFPLVNSGAKLFHDVTSFLPVRPLRAGFSPTLTINSHIRTIWGLAVMRTAWLAILCLIGLGAMVAIKAGTPTPPPNIGAFPEQTTVGKSFSQDTLTKADKLEIAYVRDPVAVEAVMLVTKAPGKTPRQPLSPAATPKILSRHWHDPKAKKSAAVSPDRRIKSQEPKKSKKVERAKAPVDLRPCRRPEGFVGLLRALNLSPGCDA